MKKSRINDTEKSSSRPRGRPPVGKLVGTRWPDEDLAAIDTYAARHEIDRAEAVRRLVRLGLTVGGRKRSTRQQQE